MPRPGEVNREHLEHQPPLHAADVPYDPPPPHMIVTVMDVALRRRGTLCKLVFREFPRRCVWATGDELLAVMEGLGERQTKEWLGRQVVVELVKRRNPRSGEEVLKYVIAPLGEWPSDMRADEIEEEQPPLPEAFV